MFTLVHYAYFYILLNDPTEPFKGETNCSQVLFIIKTIILKKEINFLLNSVICNIRKYPHTKHQCKINEYTNDCLPTILFTKTDVFWYSLYESIYTRYILNVKNENIKLLYYKGNEKTGQSLLKLSSW